MFGFFVFSDFCFSVKDFTRVPFYALGFCSLLKNSILKMKEKINFRNLKNSNEEAQDNI